MQPPFQGYQGTHPRETDPVRPYAQGQGCPQQDVAEGSGERPMDGQEVVFDYVAYNESGVRIDSSYNKGRPASIRLGINGLIPGAPRTQQTLYLVPTTPTRLCSSMPQEETNSLLLVALAPAYLLQSAIWIPCGPRHIALHGVGQDWVTSGLRGAPQGLSWA